MQLYHSLQPRSVEIHQPFCTYTFFLYIHWIWAFIYIYNRLWVEMIVPKIVCAVHAHWQSNCYVRITTNPTGNKLLRFVVDVKSIWCVNCNFQCTVCLLIKPVWGYTFQWQLVVLSIFEQKILFHFEEDKNILRCSFFFSKLKAK